MKELENGLSVEKRKVTDLKKEIDYWKDQSERSSQRSSTPPRRPRKGSVTFNEL